ncbi:MAG: CAP domain-containing protein [Pseudomonadota bacterium]|uniref:CAP domain-containing protein n=1 Tax=unclassified Phenylobacterium TaxID=2640670 RepID=UPI0006F50194|nr:MULTISPECIES: CAP domain-containing protein [unclassified Phenylobacterium]KRB40935.1 hypothetical protein ASE02_06050 [Phenylobacterium sp. Root700]MBT9470238.1 CAP domain-containing protein [Phenylobacterium sp.]
MPLDQGQLLPVAQPLEAGARQDHGLTGRRMPPTKPFRNASGLPRRALLAGIGGLVALPALAMPAGGDTAGWLSYEARLRDRLADAGGGRFEQVTERQLHTLTNGARASSGAAACGWSNELALTARAHAADLAQRGYVEHLAPEGFDPTHRVGLLARRMIGSASENIAYRRAPSPPSADDLMGIWRKSEPHWLNLLRPNHAQVGFGVVTRGERTYAVGLYAHPDGDLGAPLPFKIEGAADLSSVLAQASPRIESFALTDPLDERARLAVAQDEALTPGVYQLRPRRHLDSRRYQILWGPIFVRV